MGSFTWGQNMNLTKIFGYICCCWQQRDDTGLHHNIEKSNNTNIYIQHLRLNDRYLNRQMKWCVLWIHVWKSFILFAHTDMYNNKLMLYCSVCILGGAFLRKFARVTSSSGQWKCAFCLTRDGKAVKIQRTIFSECFYIMAMDELSRVTGDKDMQV